MASFLRLSLLPAVSWNMAGGVFVIEQRKRRKHADDNGSLIGNWSTSSDSVHHACLDVSFPPKMRFIFAGGGGGAAGQIRLSRKVPRHLTHSFSCRNLESTKVMFGNKETPVN